MDLRQLNALTAVADHGSFSRAARALYTVQSNVSAHVARLEHELGVALVDRSRGALTAAGAIVVERARRIGRELEAISTDVAALDHEVAGTTRIGVIGTTGRWLVPQLLEVLRTRHPNIRTLVLEASTSSLVPQLVAGELDVAVVAMSRPHPEIDAQVLFDEDLVALVHERHPLAGRLTTTLAELSEHRLLLSPPGTAIRDELEEVARRDGITLDPVAEVDGGRLLTSLAFEGLGVAIAPATSIPNWLKGPFARLEITGLPRRRVELARRRRAVLSAPSEALVNVLHEVIAERGPRQPGVHLIEALAPSSAAGH